MMKYYNIFKEMILSSFFVYNYFLDKCKNSGYIKVFNMCSK